MGHTPYGYRIESGCAVINEEEAAKIRSLYENYIAGMAQSKAAIEAGIETYHSSAKRLMQNRHYLGDDFYPAIIDQETFDKAESSEKLKANKGSDTLLVCRSGERIRRSEATGRVSVQPH